ncbi:flagellar protein FlaG [Thiomicrorhabdus sediminis]|uniref:Flagellar protein FlaG n=1 Tax=Thiomicrorhabdus sediminis TaxID=2580412 RepID=A0A4P9K620_9GAMM|nr:flagellar protein FlaG [Thiomicrorhabdus sediminis]QCU90462.1 flagellar protein FlaG [Thiomicrorhabdus sediminis]
MDVNFSTKISTAELKSTDAAAQAQKSSVALERQPQQKSVDSSPAKAVEKVPAEQAEKVIEALNKRFAQQERGVQFSLDQDTNSSVLKLIDKDTDEVIKQFPSEDSLRIIKNIQNYLDSANERGVSSKEGLTGSLLNEII